MASVQRFLLWHLYKIMHLSDYHTVQLTEQTVFHNVHRLFMFSDCTTIIAYMCVSWWKPLTAHEMKLYTMNWTTYQTGHNSRVKAVERALCQILNAHSSPGFSLKLLPAISLLWCDKAQFFVCWFTSQGVQNPSWVCSLPLWSISTLQTLQGEKDFHTLLLSVIHAIVTDMLSAYESFMHEVLLDHVQFSFPIAANVLSWTVQGTFGNFKKLQEEMTEINKMWERHK